MGFIGKAVKGVFKAVKKVVKGVVGFVTKAIGSVFGFGVKKPKATSQVNTLNKSLDPEANRKIVFGKTAAPMDVRFWEMWGSDGDKFDEVIALAAHKIHSVQEFYAEDKLAISAAGVVQTRFSGVLSRSVNLGNPGQSALAVGGGVLWTSASKMTGCAHMKLAWEIDEDKLPNGPPSRYTQVIEGAPVYDPRRDSTVPGGSGTHRINDQTTWAYNTVDGNGQPIGRNNALQALWYLIGWRVLNPQTGEYMLTCGRGVLPEDINLATFIAGANACEAAAYYTDMCLSTGDDHSANEGKITCDGVIARILDPGGLWSYYANVNDTASIAVDLTDDDIVQGGNVSWQEYKGIADQFNQVGGKFCNPNVNVLYQMYAYPVVRDSVYETNLGVKKRRTKDFEQVLDNTLAQRLARLFLNMGQYQGEFKARFNMRAIKAQGWSVVRYTSARYGWTKLFRVWRHDINVHQGIGLTLKEIHSSIWSGGTVANAMTPGVGSNQDNKAQYTVLGLTAQNISITGAGTYPTIQDGINVSWTFPPAVVRKTEVRYKVSTASVWQRAGVIYRRTANPVSSISIVPVIKGTLYNIEVRHTTRYGIEGPWVPVNITAGVAGNIVTANAPVLGSIDPATGRIINPTMYNTQNIMGIGNTTNIAVTYTVGGSNVTVNIPAHTRTIAGPSGPITLNYAAGSFVVAFSTYWIAYIDDPELNGANPATYLQTNNPNNLLYPHRYMVASGTTPAAGGSGGSSGGGGYGGGGWSDNCVQADSFMPSGIKARQIVAGDLVETLDYATMNDVTLTPVSKNLLAESECVKLTSESGIQLICSVTTPCTLIDRKVVMAPLVKGCWLPVSDEQGFRWEQIVEVEHVGIMEVSRISCDCQTYAAGLVPGKFIFTHNPENVQKP